MFFKHIIGGKAYTSIRPFAIMFSGIEKCEKTTALTHILSNAVLMKDEKSLTPLLQPHEHKEYLSCYELMILGTYPFDHLTWLLSTKTESAVMCLLSYFARLCKNRNIGSGNYFDLLEFVPVPATSEGIIDL